jgi:tetrahydromethanopterin S-methyltransferase subunit G
VRVAQELLPEAEVKDLQRRLNEIKSLRNAMAHNPCWFEPYLDHEEKVVRLRPKIMKGKQELTLDGERGDQIGRDIAGLVADTGRLVHLTLDPARSEADRTD